MINPERCHGDAAVGRSGAQQGCRAAEGPTHTAPGWGGADWVHVIAHVCGCTRVCMVGASQAAGMPLCARAEVWV